MDFIVIASTPSILTIAGFLMTAPAPIMIPMYNILLNPRKVMTFSLEFIIFRLNASGSGGSSPKENEGKISVQSPVAQGLLGHKVGETVKVKLPAGDMTFKIIKISR